MPTNPSQHDYETVAALRIAIRRFLLETQRVAKAHALTPQRYDLLAIIRGSPSQSLSIGELADKLSLAAHSVTELVDRAAESGLVQRADDPADGRIARVQLTRDGQRRLDRVLTSLHPERQALFDLLDRVVGLDER
jgi:DNA-binding MarR family transcriptional regulator